MAAPGAQTAEQPMQRPAPGQFNNPMQGGQGMQRPGVNPALLQALSSPWAAKNPMLAQLGAKIAGDQLTGTQFGFQVVGDQMYRTNPRTGQVEPVGVSAQKPMIIPEGGTLFDPNTKQVLATGGNKDTPDLKNYQEAVKGGFKGSFTDYQIALRRATSSQPESTFNTEVAKSQAKEFGEMAGELPNAKTDIANIKSLRAQLERLPGGFLGNAQAAAVRLGIKIGPNASAVEAADAILARLTPAQRQGMPGAASDRDVAMFRAALPSLGQTKEGQRIIMDTMEGLAQYKLAQAEIAQQARLGKIKPEQAMERLSTIPDPFEQFRNIQGQTPQGAAPAGTPGQVQTITRDQYQALPSGSKFIAADDPTKTVRTKP
jgi:flagellar protein FlgJ